MSSDSYETPPPAEYQQGRFYPETNVFPPPPTQEYAPPPQQQPYNNAYNPADFPPPPGASPAALPQGSFGGGFAPPQRESDAFATEGRYRRANEDVSPVPVPELSRSGA